MGKETKVLRNKEFPLVKVQWDESHPSDTTWVLESEMREAYPYLFLVMFKFEDIFLFKWGGCNTPYFIKYSNSYQLRSTELLCTLNVIN